MSDERGLTLIEVLVAVTVTALLMGGVGSVALTSLRAVQSGARTAEVVARRLLVLGTFADDGRDAVLVTLPPDPPPALGCGDVPDPSATQLADLRWTDLATGAPTAVAYRLEEGRLVRWSCAASGELGRLTLADDVAAATVTTSGRSITLAVEPAPPDDPFALAVTRRGPEAPP